MRVAYAQAFRTLTQVAACRREFLALYAVRLHWLQVAAR